MKTTNKKKLTRSEQRNLTPEELLPHLEEVRDKGGRLSKDILQATISAVEETMANKVYKVQLEVCRKKTGKLGDKIGNLKFHKRETELKNKALVKQVRRLRTTTVLQSATIIFITLLYLMTQYG